MRHCPECGTEIESPTAKFCPRCGQYIFPPHIATPVEGLVEEDHVYAPFPKKWVVTYGMCFDERHDVDKEYREMSYPEACDKLEQELTTGLSESLHEVKRLEDQRDGECLSLRYSFMVFGPDAFPKMPHLPPFHVLEVLPFTKVYDQDDE